MIALTQKEVRQLKSRAQVLKPALKLGRQGVTDQFVQAMDEMLKHHDLIKLKFDDFKEQRHELAPQIAERTRSQLVWIVGHVAVFFRPKPSATPPS